MLELNKIYCIDCLDGLKQLEDNSVDAVVTDPPYELGFMGKQWDCTGIAYNVNMWKECYRVLKPGGHLPSFGGSRTYHRMACAVEDAGFEIRDQIMWVFGSGFPKSLNIGKQIDKLQGNKRELIGIKQHAKKDFKDNLYAQDPANRNNEKVFGYGEEKLTKGSSDWEGWGTALKPSHEPIVLARKPLSEKTIALNVLRWGVGGLNINGCRIPAESELSKNWTNRKAPAGFRNGEHTLYGKGETDDFSYYKEGQGRFPANFIHDGSDDVLELFPETKSGDNCKRTKVGSFLEHGGLGKAGDVQVTYGDSGSAARFFYCAKASKSERNAGLEGYEKEIGHNRFDKCANCGGYLLQNPDRPSACKCKHPVREHNIIKGNFHPTVKPIALIEYLIKLVTREKQIVLDPFIGSGTTALACKKLNRHFIGFELNPDYCKIAEKRLNNIPKQLERFMVEED